jgi:hypothetical protein
LHVMWCPFGEDENWAGVHRADRLCSCALHGLYVKTVSGDVPAHVILYTFF